MEFIEKKASCGESVADVKQPDTNREDVTGGKILDLAEYLERSIRKAAPAAKSRGDAKPKAAARKAAKKNAEKKSTSKKGRQSA